MDITATGLAGESVDLVIASHVLEHVDDRAALAEIHRILRPGGEALLLMPVAEGWAETFEDATIVTRAGRHRYFTQHDHLRHYGADVRGRIRDAGFALTEFTADGHQCGDLGIARGETLFLARRPAA